MPTFDVDECAALAMKACLEAMNCLLEELDFPSLNETFEAGTELAAGARLVLDGEHECLGSAIRTAFEDAGIPFPGVPNPPQPPNFDDCMAAAESIKSQIEDPLGFLEGIMEIEFDEDGLPIRITVP